MLLGWEPKAHARTCPAEHAVPGLPAHYLPAWGPLRPPERCWALSRCLARSVTPDMGQCLSLPVLSSPTCKDPHSLQDMKPAASKGLFAEWWQGLVETLVQRRAAGATRAPSRPPQ